MFKRRKNQFATFVILITAILLCVGSSYAQEAEKKEEIKRTGFGVDPLYEHNPFCTCRIFGDSKLLDDFHNPTDWIQIGADFRLRHVYAKNAITQNTQDANNEWHYGRYRTRLSAKFKLGKDVDFNTRLVWEWRHWDQPRNKPSTTDLDEILFDHFNLTVRNLFDMPLTGVFGRQDIILGDGWLVLDGTPADGSRTICFDAARFTYQLSDETKADLVFIYQFNDENKWLSPIDHERDTRRFTNYQDEKGMILYVSHKADECTTVDGYYIYKEDNQSRGTAVITEHSGVDSEIHTFGTRIVRKLDENWKWKGEIAKQFGRKDKDKLDSLGGTTRLTYAFNDEKSNELFFDYEYLSGDDPDTGTDEEFDPLWGEWPQYSRGGDLPAYIWAQEGAVGAVSNLHRIGVGHRFKPWKKWTFETLYNLMFADDNAPARDNRLPNPGKYATGGSLRGQMLTAYWKYRCCKNLSYHFLLDYFVPGSYYSQPNRDAAVFLRFNIQFAF